MVSVIPSGSIPPPPVHSWGSKNTLEHNEVPIGTLAIVKPYINGLFKHEWAGEVVVVMGLVHYNMTAVPFYKVMCHRGSMIVSVNNLNIIS
jgi:hypothetical protein